MQEAYNKAHNITPKTIKKAVEDILTRENEIKKEAAATETEPIINSFNILNPADRKKLIKRLEAQMAEYADMLMFEEAAVVRDKIEEIKRIGS